MKVIEIGGGALDKLCDFESIENVGVPVGDGNRFDRKLFRRVFEGVIKPASEDICILDVSFLERYKIAGNGLLEMRDVLDDGKSHIDICKTLVIGNHTIFAKGIARKDFARMSICYYLDGLVIAMSEYHEKDDTRAEVWLSSKTPPSLVAATRVVLASAWYEKYSDSRISDMGPGDTLNFDGIVLKNKSKLKMKLIRAVEKVV